MINEVIKSHGEKLVQFAAETLAKGAKERILGQRDIVPDVEGGAETPTTPLQPEWIAKKQKRGGRLPTIPRFMTGRLFESIAPEPLQQGLFGPIGSVAAGAEYAGVQQSGGGPWMDAEDGRKYPGTRARPFLGISQSELVQIDNRLQSEGVAMLAELDALELPPLAISLTV